MPCQVPGNIKKPLCMESQRKSLFAELWAATHYVWAFWRDNPIPLTRTRLATTASSRRMARPTADLTPLLQVLHSADRVAGLTHPLYRYPARFSPQFVRASILALTDSGDLVVDPFVGGGTTLVEGMALGRRVLGTDINELAVFVSRAKTTLLSVGEGARLLRWAEHLDARTTSQWHRASQKTASADHRVPWAIRKSIQLCLDSGLQLPTKRLRRMARATLLRLGQWALDGRSEVPSRRQFIAKHHELTKELIAGSHELGTTAAAAFDLSRAETERQRQIIRTSAEHIAQSGGGDLKRQPPKLILTSPPYHGVHILYHRWQVRGRRETNAPYWVTGSRDGNAAGFYTFGSRAYAEEVRGEYFENALLCFSGIRAICDRNTTLVQLVGFSNPREQLPLYEELMAEAGFEAYLPDDGKPLRAKLTRSVPNRKWYLSAMKRYAASEHEYLLIHRIAT